MKKETQNELDKLQKEIEISLNNATKAYSKMKKILRNQVRNYNEFIENQQKDKLLETQQEFIKTMFLPLDQKSLLKVELKHLNFSARSANCLDNANIKFVYELVSKTEGELLRMNNFGRKSLNEIIEVLWKIGLRLGMKL